MSRSARCITAALLVAMAATMIDPQTARAQWRDPEPLPGIVSTKTLVITGLVVAGVVAVLVASSRSGGAKAKKGSENQAAPADSLSESSQGALMQVDPDAPDAAHGSLRVDERLPSLELPVFVGFDPSEKRFTVGITTRF